MLEAPAKVSTEVTLPEPVATAGGPEMEGLFGPGEAAAAALVVDPAMKRRLRHPRY